MKRVLFFMFMLSCGQSFALDIGIEEGSNQIISILTHKGQHIQAYEHNIRIKLIFPPGKVFYIDVRQLYEPRNKLFWWEYQNATPNKNQIGVTHPAIVYATGAKMVGFAYSDGIIWVLDMSDRYSSAKEGQDNVVEFIKNEATHEAGKIEREYGIHLSMSRMIKAGIAMNDAFGFDFFHYQNRAISHQPTIIDIKKYKNWHLIFEGINKAKGEVVLGEDYQVISAALLPNKKKRGKKK